MTLYFHNATCTEEPDRATGEEVEDYDFWNLWKVRMAPWAELSEGDHVVLVETWPGGSRLTWEMEVTGVVKDVYSRKADAVRAIAAFHGLTRGEVLSDPYTADKSDEGVYLAWAGKPVRALYVPRPADLPMRRNGWAVVEDDDLLQSWGIAVTRDDPTSMVAGNARDAVQVLTDLIGRELATTRRGRGNRVLSVQPPNVIVGTKKSPQGQPVPIGWVQYGLDLLRRHGAVTVDVETLGHRSSFVGAVLATLPRATVSGSPPVLSLLGDAGDAQSGETTFDGDTSSARTVETRKEQRSLRALLFKLKTSGRCALCGEEYPVQFLRAAHIKPRSKCTEDERRQLSRIAMPACVFGCDALFEAGLVAVDHHGRTVVSAEVDATPALSRRAETLAGQPCSALTAQNAEFFAWHRENSFRG